MGQERVLTIKNDIKIDIDWRLHAKIQELMEENDALKAENEKLKIRITELENQESHQ